MSRAIARCAVAAAALLAASSIGAQAASRQVERGKYLVTFGGCNDCHTPGYFLGKPDMKRYLGGSDVAFEIPGVGAFVGRNITPDKETGIGTWTKAQIVTALTAGKRPDGRTLAPIMPWHALAHLTKRDANAIAAYLQTIPAVSHKVPDPIGVGQKVPTFLFRILPPGQTVAEAPKPPAGAKTE
jgi:mono/diheme cytochrome c family protein